MAVERGEGEGERGREGDGEMRMRRHGERMRARAQGDGARETAHWKYMDGQGKRGKLSVNWAPEHKINHFAPNINSSWCR